MCGLNKLDSGFSQKSFGRTAAVETAETAETAEAETDQNNKSPGYPGWLN